ncbi:hypothetical protein B0H19DRAFT_1059941 [Mycena capillaripes]|nr:hypothetical protein B0H19DRAFT_1059941 [Mycena capillaripes]
MTVTATAVDLTGRQRALRPVQQLKVCLTAPDGQRDGCGELAAMFDIFLKIQSLELLWICGIGVGGPNVPGSDPVGKISFGFERPPTRSEPPQGHMVLSGLQHRDCPKVPGYQVTSQQHSRFYNPAGLFGAYLGILLLLPYKFAIHTE